MKFRQIETLWVEESNGIPLSKDKQESIFIPSGGTSLRRATLKEIEEAEKYYKENRECKDYHLIYDKYAYGYYQRYCGICGKYIGLI